MRFMRSSTATIAVAMSIPCPARPLSGSSIFAKRCGSVLQVEARGIELAVHLAPAQRARAGSARHGRSENGATMVMPCPFWPQSM
jgi:hypothetical protein